MDEILLIDKPAGMTSFGVVARVRRVLSEQAGKKVKVGHTGTLDPFATGLLILMTGKMTRKCEEFLKLDKKYTATICLGKTSTTGDVEGEIRDFYSSSPRSSRLSSQGSAAMPRQQPAECAEEPKIPNFPAASPVAKKIPEKCIHDISQPQQPAECAEEPKIPNFPAVSSVVKSFQGETTQRVPAYSAVKINGKRAYDLARKGVEVKMPERKVTIYNIEILSYEWPYLKISCHVSSGTYIRTLGEDIGKKLGVGGYLTELRRTAIGKYDVSQAKSLKDLGIEN